MTIRVQITKKPTVSSIDGVRIDTFEVGHVYEIGTSIATVLLAEGWATPAADEKPAFALSGATDFGITSTIDPGMPPNLTREHHPPYVEPREDAADKKSRGKPPRR